MRRPEDKAGIHDIAYMWMSFSIQRDSWFSVVPEPIRTGGEAGEQIWEEGTIHKCEQGPWTEMWNNSGLNWRGNGTKVNSVIRLTNGPLLILLWSAPLCCHHVSCLQVQAHPLLAWSSVCLSQHKHHPATNSLAKPQLESMSQANKSVVEGKQGVGQDRLGPTSFISLTSISC
jgi:hypothetical protein